MSTSRDDVLRALDQVIDPVSGRSVVQENMITGLVLLVAASVDAISRRRASASGRV